MRKLIGFRYEMGQLAPTPSSGGTTPVSQDLRVSGRGNRAARIGAACISVSVLLLSACSSSESSPSSSTTNSSDAAAYVTESSDALTTVLDGLPTEYQGPDPATDAVKPPKDVSLALVPCGQTTRGCAAAVEFAQDAAELLGWKVTVFDGKNTPADQNKAVMQAVSAGANAIITAGVDPNQIQSGLKAAHDANIVIGDMGQYVEPATGQYQFEVAADYKALGTAIGQYVVADSDGKAVLLPFNDKEFNSVINFNQAERTWVEGCSTCKLYPNEDFVAADLASTFGPRVVSLLQAHPDVTYVDPGYDPAAAVIVPLIDQAGLGDRVKVVSLNGDPQNLQFIKDKHIQSASIAFDWHYIGWMGVYQAARVLSGEQAWTDPAVTDPIIVGSGGVPYQLYTWESPAENTDFSADGRLGYVAKFKQLLGIS